MSHKFRIEQINQSNPEIKTEYVKNCFYAPHHHMEKTKISLTESEILSTRRMSSSVNVESEVMSEGERSTRRSSGTSMILLSSNPLFFLPSSSSLISSL